MPRAAGWFVAAISPESADLADLAEPDRVVVAAYLHKVGEAI